MDLIKFLYKQVKNNVKEDILEKSKFDKKSKKDKKIKKQNNIEKSDTNYKLDTELIKTEKKTVSIKEKITSTEDKSDIDKYINMDKDVLSSSELVNLKEVLINNMDKTEHTNNIDKIFNEYFDNEDIIESSFNDISTKFLDIINQIELDDISLPSKEFDVIFTGGGLKGYYNFGACEILKKLVQNDKAKIRNYVGVSVGAYVAVFLLLGISIHRVRNVYEFARCNSNKHDLNKIMLKACDNLLPNNIHELCNGKLKILVSELTIKGMVPVIIDNFQSKEHLIKVLHATSFIPFITSTESKGIEINGKKYYDGAFTNNIPISLNNDLPQLVFYTGNVEYSKDYMFKILDNCPELLILRGAIEMEKFVKKLYRSDIGKINKVKDIPIEWITADTNQKKISKKNSEEYQKYILNILLLVSLIVSSISSVFTINFGSIFKDINFKTIKSKTTKSKTTKSKTTKSKTTKSKTTKTKKN